MLQMVLLAFVIAVAVTGLVVIVMLLRPWDLLSPKTTVGQKNIYTIKTVYNNFALGVYHTIRGFGPTNIFVTNLSASLRHMYVLDDDESRVKATSLLIKQTAITLVTLVLCVEYFDDTLLALITTIMISIYFYQKLMGDGQKFLEELEETLSDMIHIYNAEGKNIDMMFARMLKDRDLYTHRYVDQMYTYLKRALLDAEHSQEIIAEYNKLAPSRHLRLVFNYVYITARYGDETNTNGEQLFNRNMLAIQREVHADLVKMVSIKDSTLGDQVFIIISVLIIPIVTWYMTNFFTFEGFETVGRFLNSSLGYTIKIICAVVALICFIIYTRLMAANVTFEQYKEFNWAEVILNKNPWLKSVVDRLGPKPGTKRREKLESEITLTEGYVGIRPLYLKKIIMAVVLTFVVGLLLTLDTATLYYGIANDINRGVNSEYMGAIIEVENGNFGDRYKEQSLENDMMVIEIIKKDKDTYFSLTEPERINYIQKIIWENEDIDYGKYPDVAAKRIAEKFIQLEQMDGRLLALILVLTFFIAYMIPNMIMKLNLALNQGAIIYDEVIGCYTIVILLIHHPASNIYMLMNWLTSFAHVFKTRLQQCVDNLTEKEIMNLEKGVDYKPFSRLIECILMVYNGTDLQSAFAGIEQRHMFQEESRRLINEQIVKRRVTYSNVLSWGALGCTFLLYIMIPMAYAIVEMLLQLV